MAAAPARPQSAPLADPDALRQLRTIGVSRAIFALPPKGRDAVLPLLDRYAEAMRAVDA